MSTELCGQIIACIRKWNVAPSTQRICDKFRLHTWAEVERALSELRDDGKIACSNGRWYLLGQGARFGCTDSFRKRKAKKPQPGRAEARTLSLLPFGGDS